jgi:hypothetical protein
MKNWNGDKSILMAVIVVVTLGCFILIAGFIYENGRAKECNASGGTLFIQGSVYQCVKGPVVIPMTNGSETP